MRFRSSSVDRSIDACGRLLIIPEACSGKRLATTLEHASLWGKRLNGDDFVVAEVEIEDRYVKDLCFIGDNLDMIGPAYFADEHQLSFCKVIGIHE